MPSMQIKKSQEAFDVIIIGAGACGLMAARELSKKKKKVLIIEARERAGGRIWTLPSKEFGEPVDAGAEFIHGHAKATKSLLKEAKLSFEPVRGDRWILIDDELRNDIRSPPPPPSFNTRLKGLKKDMPIASFLAKYFSGAENEQFRIATLRMVQSYEAAEPSKMSIFALREDWLSSSAWRQARVKGGYGPMIDFLLKQCKNQGVQTLLGTRAISLDASGEGVSIACSDGKTYFASCAIVTLPLPLIKSINYNPPIPSHLTAASNIGYGTASKVLLKFKKKWWAAARGKDLSKMSFVISTEPVGVWWTQYPSQSLVLTGWLGGPFASKQDSLSEQELISLGIKSLAAIFQVDEAMLRKNLTASKAVQWSRDPFSKGAYSYSSVGAKTARLELAKPFKNKVFFAGEAIGKDPSLVEGALSSGLETAKKILSKPSK